MIVRYKVLEKYINGEFTGIYKKGDEVDISSDESKCLV